MLSIDMQFMLYEEKIQFLTWCPSSLGVRSKRPRTKTAAYWNGRRPIRLHDKTGAWTDLSI